MIGYIKNFIKNYTTGIPFVLFFVAGAAATSFFLFFEYLKHLEHFHFEKVVYVLVLSGIWFVFGDILKKKKIFSQSFHFIIDSVFYLLTFGFIVYYTGGMHGDFSAIFFLAVIGAAIYGTNFQTLIFLLILSAESYFICVLADEGVNIYHLGVTTLYAVFYFIIAGLIKYFYISAKKSREEYVELIETTPLCIKVFDENMKMVFLNKGGREEHFIKDTDDISKWDWVGTIKEKYQAEAKEKFQNAFTKGESSTLEFEHTPESSTHEWCSSLISPIKDKDGKVKSVLFLSSDITELKKTEERLLKNQKEQELILDSTPSWIFYKDTENRFIRVNKSFAEIMKMPKEKLEGASLFDIYPKEQAEAFWADDKAVIASGKPKLNIIESMNSSKGILWVQTDKIPYRDEGGKIIGILGFATDITSKKLIEEEKKKNLEKMEETKIALFNILEDVKESEVNLKEERDRSQAIITSMGEGLIVIDKDYRIVMANSVAARIFELPLEKIINRNTKEIFSFFKGDQELSDKEQPIARTFMTGEAVIIRLEDNYYLRIASGKKIPVDITATPLRGDGITAVVIVFQNITKEKSLDEAKNSFISIASHQLRTPLTSIRWYAEMLDSEDVGPLNKEQKEFVGRVYGGALKLNEVINLLLSLARVESGKAQVDIIKIDLLSFTNDILKELDPLLKQKNLTIKILASEKEIPQINYDAAVLRQIITNLLSNSIRYTNNNGRIEVKIEEMPGEIVYSVKDDGIGIPESHRSKIFNKFFRAENAISKVPDGSGLGLSLVKALVEMDKGAVWFESPVLWDNEKGEKEKKGTTFHFTIPLSFNQQPTTNNSQQL